MGEGVGGVEICASYGEGMAIGSLYRAGIGALATAIALHSAYCARKRSCGWYMSAGVFGYAQGDSRYEASEAQSMKAQCPTLAAFYLMASARCVNDIEGSIARWQIERKGGQVGETLASRKMVDR